MLYDLLIGPLEYFFKMAFYMFYNNTFDVVISLLCLSLFVNILTAPVYNRAEKLKQDDQDMRRGMKHYMDHIKDTFKGEERIFMREYYYKLCGYSPVYAFKAVVPLIIQIPFFLAAYNMLSKIQGIPGDFFEQADGWLKIGGSEINILPILMTLINIISCLIYSSGRSIKEKAGMLILPVFFLIVLYKSPYGIVLYWTFNNTFSLIRIVSMQVKAERVTGKVKKAIVYALGMFFYSMCIFKAGYASMAAENDNTIGIVAVFILVSYNIPLLLAIIFKDKALSFIKNDLCKQNTATVILKEIFLLAFGIIYISVAVISDSPSEFPINSLFDIVKLLYKTIIYGAGIFLVWGNVIYYALKGSGRTIYSGVLSALSVIFVADHFLWSNDMGNLMLNLRFENAPQFGYKKLLISIIVFYLCVFLGMIMVSVLRKYEKKFFSILCLVISFVVMIYLFRINTIVGRINDGSKEGEENIFEFSKNGKNVLIIMIDRAVGAYVPYIMNEIPGLEDKYSGFVWYPNAVSFAGHTNLGAPALFGGYEYTPLELNKRNKESMKDKHKEALRVLPELFSDGGWMVHLADLPYADYSYEGGMDGFKDISNTKARNLEKRYAGMYGADFDVYGRAFWDYCVYKTSPYFLQHFIYYDAGNDDNGFIEGYEFANSYALMEDLPALTVIDDLDNDHFIEWDTNLAHDIRELQLPDYRYIQGQEPDNSSYVREYLECDGKVMKLDSKTRRSSFHVNVVTLKMLGEWFDLLRQYGVYDNTRIILAADHGSNMHMFEYMKVNEEVDVQRFNCLLMVKDFNATGFCTDYSFMTNADVPAVAMHGVLDDPVNPYTGKEIKTLDTADKEAIITLSTENGLTEGNIYNTSDAGWYGVSRDIFNKDNWEKISVEE